jgi:hypothetical protein
MHVVTRIALRLAIAPVAVYIGVALALLHARVAWRLIDGPAATPALASGPQATMHFDRHGEPRR